VTLPDRMSDPSAEVITAALRGLDQADPDTLLRRLPPQAARSPFQQRVAEELERLAITRLLWLGADHVTDLEIWRRKRFTRATVEELRDLLLDRYRAVGLHGRVEGWIRTTTNTKED
jgi:hypothetical protein